MFSIFTVQPKGMWGGGGLVNENEIGGGESRRLKEIMVKLSLNELRNITFHLGRGWKPIGNDMCLFAFYV
jgi:hypothetical protein